MLANKLYNKEIIKDQADLFFKSKRITALTQNRHYVHTINIKNILVRVQSHEVENFVKNLKYC